MTLTLVCEILGAMRYKCSGVNQDEVNADLRARFGETCTRTQILAYRDETGIDPRWIRKGSACNIGRGLYRIPGGTEWTPSELPAWTTPVRLPKPAKREKLASDVRSVIPSPFDDGAYDEPEEESADEAPKKRGRKSKLDDPDNPQALINQPDYDPGIGERAAPVFVHAWVCDARQTTMCPGRKPGSFYPENGQAPVCECGSPMTRHSWAPSKKLF